ncbi:hypothetical protein F4818DRAFT_410305 [Hypoxylon cercidicola]|nr:hypothetical protein F4818DRAFT_410305 [Hypoxylon cercidicola]
MKTWKDYVHPDFAGKDYDTDERPINPDKINTYVAECLQFWEDDDLNWDWNLWHNFKEDFRDWTNEHFRAMDRILRNIICKYLYLHGLYAGDCRTNVDSLMKILNATEYPQFPPEAAAEEAGKSPDTFISFSNPYFKELYTQRSR